MAAPEPSTADSNQITCLVSLSAEQPLSPIQRLPIDVLAEIFTHCLPEWEQDNQHTSVISSRKAPLLLCRICSSWRSLAISTPCLWQTFNLELYAYTETSVSKLKLLASDIRTWFGRSRTLPLSIRFILCTDSTSLVAGALSALFEFSSRWESIFIETFPQVPLPNLGVLQSLRDYNAGTFSVDEFPFTSAPHLKSLSIHTLPCNPTSVSSIPWNQLTELYTTRSVSLSMISELFLGFPRLEKLCIRVQFEPSYIKRLESMPRIKHDNLRCLWLYMTLQSGVAVDFVTLPKLKELHLVGISSSSHRYSHSDLLDLFTRSKCKLQKLVVTCSLMPDELLVYLEHPCCQTLTCLSIYDDCLRAVDNEFLSRLTFPEDKNKAPPLCRKLTELCLKSCYHCSVSRSADSLGRMVYSRCFGRAKDEQLKSLDLVSWYLSEPDWELLEFAQDRGGLKFSHA